MAAALLSVLLLVSPIQDSISVEQHERLENEVEELESEMEGLEREVQGYEVDKKFFDNALNSERTWWATFVTVIITLVVAAIGGYSYNKFVTRIHESETDLKETERDIKRRLSKFNNRFEDLRDKHLSSYASLSRVYANLHEDGERYGKAVVNRLDAVESVCNMKYATSSHKDNVRVGLRRAVENLEDAIESGHWIDVGLKGEIKEKLVFIMSNVEGHSMDYANEIYSRIDELEEIEVDGGNRGGET